MPDDRQHWEQIYNRRAPDEVSWFEPAAKHSLTLIEAAGLDHAASLLDLGGGASRLAGALLAAGFSDVTVADLSARALEQARAELGGRGKDVGWVEADVRRHDFGRRFDLWHDRAVFHFMVDDADRDAYLATLRSSVAEFAHVIIATFGPEGPTQCSGLPVSRYSAEELAAQLGAEFESLSSELVVHRTPSGNEQQFVYSHFRRREG